ncbi:hypothetical protein [Streptomyces sp. NBC_00986]|uniref:hypothetical protein n=1 Tax=Streptomyces sp. NBC_00986 TaxID=2903702 RepID=UPI0038693382|nr:hypothetical protein OG504_20055 [Streptomyces sp. NBC_00986]
MSTREFAAAAVDPDTEWSPSKSLVAKIIGDQGYDVTPQLVGALAVGLGIDRAIVAAAAHLQVIGYTEVELASGAPAVLLRMIGPDGEADGSTDKAQAIAERWDAEQ